jgi:fermentation-respiration switch protein FrsA (DUF1100 family)
MVALKWVAVWVAAGYLTFVVFLYLVQRSMLYRPLRASISPAEAGLPEVERAVASSSDGEKVVVWHLPASAGMPAVIYFPGNAEIIASRTSRFREVTAEGAGLIALSYRGYMESTGRPTEDGLLRDAEAAYQFAMVRYSPHRILLWGHSLGSGVAVALAAARPVAGLVLEAPFTSTADVAARLFPIVPVRWLMLDQFRSDRRIAEVQAPILFLHGARDVVVPIKLGKRLFALAPEPKRFVRYPQGGHDDLDRFGAAVEARRFISETGRESRRPLP